VITEIYDKIPETAKVGTAVGPAALTLAGLPLDQWILILSAIVSLLVIIEKLPRAIDSMKILIAKFKNGNKSQ
jgi:hypothetical protein